MTKRFVTNVAAAMIVAAGGLTLTSSPAKAAHFGGCEDMQAALTEFARQCSSTGGTSVSYVGSCSDQGYTLNASCYRDNPSGGGTGS